MDHRRVPSLEIAMPRWNLPSTAPLKSGNINATHMQHFQSMYRLWLYTRSMAKGDSSLSAKDRQDFRLNARHIDIYVSPHIALKTIVNRQIRYHTLTLYPLTVRQYAKQPGKSTVSAVDDLNRLLTKRWH